MATTERLVAPVKDSPLLISLAWIGLAVAIGAGIYWLNPAIALLGGLAVRLVLDVNPVAASGSISKLALQSAIVLLGATLGLDQLVQVSADYGIVVAIYVIGTLMLGVAAAGLWQRMRHGADEVEQRLLTGGTAICGGTAIATLAPLMRASAPQLAVAAALVFLLNVVAVFTFPGDRALARTQSGYVRRLGRACGT